MPRDPRRHMACPRSSCWWARRPGRVTAIVVPPARPRKGTATQTGLRSSACSPGREGGRRVGFVQNPSDLAGSLPCLGGIARFGDVFPSAEAVMAAPTGRLIPFASVSGVKAFPPLERVREQRYASLPSLACVASAVGELSCSPVRGRWGGRDADRAAHARAADAAVAVRALAARTVPAGAGASLAWASARRCADRTSTLDEAGLRPASDRLAGGRVDLQEREIPVFREHHDSGVARHEVPSVCRRVALRRSWRHLCTVHLKVDRRAAARASARYARVRDLIAQSAARRIGASQQRSERRSYLLWEGFSHRPWPRRPGRTPRFRRCRSSPLGSCPGTAGGRPPPGRRGGLPRAGVPW